jgi:hypothetical protein
MSMMKFVLIALLTNTQVGEYRTMKSCQAAIRVIYEQKVDPLHIIRQKNPASFKQIVDIRMKYSAPYEYKCLRK